MKIAYIVTRSDSIGGAQHHVRDVAVEMLARGHEPHVLVGGDGPYLSMLESSRLPFTQVKHLVRPLAPHRDLACLFELRRHLRRLRPDVVHTHSSKAGIVGRLAAKTLRLPNVFSAHGWSFTEGINPKSAAIYRQLERRAAKWCNRILVGCERDRQLGLACGVGNESLVQTIWYGLPSLESNILAQPAQQPPRLVMVARFEDQKDHQTLLKGLAQVSDLEWSIDLVGDGPLRPSMERLAAECGLSDRVRFLGARPTLDILKEAQLFLLITNWEGLPLSVLEAMRIGLPVIGSDVGGIPEQVLHGENGYVIPRGDADQLARWLRKLIADPVERERMGQASRRRFQECFQASTMHDKIEAVYEQLRTR